MITYWNPAAERLFGFSSEQALRQQTDLIIPDRFLKAHRAAIERFRHGGATTILGKTVEVIARRADGIEIPIELSLSAWPTAGGVALGAHAQDISARKARESKLEQLAKHDDLTGLLTLTEFCECLGSRMKTEQGATILKFDIEKFKAINDSFGRSAGDALLQAIAIRIRAVGTQDWEFGRAGGDKFLVLLPTPIDLFASRDAAHALLAAFQQPFAVEGHAINLTISVGVASLLSVVRTFGTDGCVD